jgi:hypothetical protein
MAALKENSKNIFNYVREHEDENITAQDIADALGLGVKQVNGSVTSAFQRKGLMERIEAERTLEDGTHAKVKFIKLTDLGRAFDPESAE